ncbi:MAG: DUF885 domain-containing protein [Bacillota bacterium]|nr:DUF885 domain-containing protein [Bacillota bacterium]
MSPRKNLTPKQRFLCIAILIFAFIGIVLVWLFTDDARKFRLFSRNLFISELSGDTLSLHYTLAYPEKFNLDTQACLPSYHTITQQDAVYISSLLDQLSGINPDRLNDEDAYTYGLLVRYLTLQLSGCAFPYYREPLSPSSGMQASLPILLADYTFRSGEDVEDYLKLLDQTDTYFDALIQYEEEKSSQGLFMSDSAAAKIIRQCTSIMDEKDLSSGTHFLHSTFTERLSELKSKGLINQQQYDMWCSENDRLLTTVMAPAYEKTADAFTILSGSGVNDEGLCHFPDGRAYYEYLLSLNTGSSKSIPEIKQLLFQDFQQNYTSLISLLQKYPELSAYNFQTTELPFSSPEEMLSDLQVRMREDFPAFPSTKEEFSPVCTIKKVSSAMEAYSSPAYYLTPPIDDLSSNIIYINHRNQPDSLTLYTTLAHEGYPGHLYQTVYSQLYFNSRKDSTIRSILHYGGYVEGWAYYVENMSYIYAQSIAKDDPLTCAWYEACRLNRNLQLCMYSLLDIAIHYEGAGPSHVQQILMKIGISDTKTTTAVYQYIVEEPANYLKYYLGYLEFQELKVTAQRLWGEDFSNKRFHQFVLETGPSDFRGLQIKLEVSGAVTAS